jgi:malonate transporter
LNVITIILPIFLIIFIGYIAGKFKRRGEHAASELNKAVVWVFLPTLLFKVCATVHISEIWNIGFFLAFTLPTFIIFFLIVTLRLFKGHDLSVAW